MGSRRWSHRAGDDGVKPDLLDWSLYIQFCAMGSLLYEFTREDLEDDPPAPAEDA